MLCHEKFCVKTLSENLFSAGRRVFVYFFANDMLYCKQTIKLKNRKTSGVDRTRAIYMLTACFVIIEMEWRTLARNPYTFTGCLTRPSETHQINLFGGKYDHHKPRMIPAGDPKQTCLFSNLFGICSAQNQSKMLDQAIGPRFHRV